MRRSHRLRLILPAAFALVVAACGSTPESPAPSLVPAPTDAPSAAATPSPSASPSATPLASPSPSVPVTGIVAADLDGVMVDASLAHRLPLAVSIDDSRAARPQAGFNQASIVYHMPADGYEVRYLLVFQEGNAKDIGPVRSARNFQAMWASEYRSALAHYGGDRISRKWIGDNNRKKLTNVDGMGRGNAAFHRIKTRKAPHNAYTSTDALFKMAVKLGASKTFDPAMHVRPFRDDSPVAERGTAQKASIPYRTVTVGYAYDPASNGYLRTLDGKPQIDTDDGKQVTTRTVMILYMSFRTDGTIERGHARPVLGYIGTGKGVVLSEGKSVAVTWSKAGEQDPTIVTGPDGNELSLIRGRIFIQAVPIGTKVTIR
jgi:hypothetical protein